MSLRRPLEEGVERLKGLIGDMAATALRVLRDSMEEAVTYEDVNPKRVRMFSDQLRFMMREADKLVDELIVRYHPMASDLRIIKSCLKISYDFNRIGRYALDISEMRSILGDHRCGLRHSRKMYNLVAQMVNEAGRAFILEDLELAERILGLDEEVDKLYYEYLGKIIREKQSSNPICVILETLVLRHLERIADHACYIAETVIYMKSGYYEHE